MVNLPEIRTVTRFKLSILLTCFLLGVQVSFATIPPNYYDGATETGSALKTQLYNIIKGHTSISYDYIWTAIQTTDDKPNGKVWDMYSDIPGGTPPYEFTFITDQCGSAGAEGVCYSREHSFPKSWFGGEVSPMYTDLFHIVPTDQYVNNMRSDHPYGKVTSPTWTSLNGSKRGPCATPGYTGVVFEPRDEYKGDFARNYFYMATRYENLIASWQYDNAEGAEALDGTSYPCYKTWYLKQLFEWNAQDTVSQKEIDRNDAIYPIQHNRNPYIDHPEYAGLIWGFPTPKTLAATNLAATSATLNGTINPDGVATTYHFEWGTSISYGNSTTTTSAGSGTSVVAVNANITSLASGTIYHFRIVGVNSNGTINGLDRTFTTLLPPTLTVTPSDRPVTAASGSTTFAVTSNTSWTAVSNQTSWCTVTPSGSGNGTITANYTTNTASPRIANITVTVTGLTPVVVTVTQAGGSSILPEPTNFPTNFSTHNITIHWTDATEGVLPTGYLVRMSSIGFSSISVPVDGIPVTDSNVDKNIASGIQEAVFKNLAPNTTYYFKIFSYQGTGSGIDYKTDGAVPQVQQTTQP